MPIRDARWLQRSLYNPGSRRYWAMRSDGSRVLFDAMLASADDEGRGEAELEDLKALCPRSKWSLKDVEKFREEQRRARLVRFYRVGGKWYYQIYKFVELQRWHSISDRRAEFPAPPERKKRAQNDHPKSTDRIPIDMARNVLNQELGSREERSGTAPSLSSPPTPPSSAPLGEVQEGASRDVGEESAQALRNCARWFKEHVKSLGFKRSFGSLNGSGGKIERWSAKWFGLISTYGADVVERAVQVWAQGRAPADLARLHLPVAIFLDGRDLEENIDTAIEQLKKGESSDAPGLTERTRRNIAAAEQFIDEGKTR